MDYWDPYLGLYRLVLISSVSWARSYNECGLQAKDHTGPKHCLGLSLDLRPLTLWDCLIFLL